KYYNWRLDSDIFTHSRNSSRVWHKLVHGARTLKKGLRSSIWNVFEDQVIAPIPNLFVGVTVADMWTSNGWNWQVLSTLLSPATRVLDYPTAGDKLYWSANLSGLFLSAMHLLREDVPYLATPGLWCKIWRVRTQERER
ncbi:LOW QUALITY PROTEIN: hypothetical protein V2J09_022556, partial [Rumex salicifolius]